MSSGAHPLNGKHFDENFAKATPKKIGMWLFLATDGMSFSGLLLAYAVLRATYNWPNPADHLGLTLSGIATFILICSSVSMVLSIDACKQHDRKNMLRWLLFTIIGGACFLGIQVYEYSHLIEHGLTLTHFAHGTNLFGSTFFIVTGFHGFHVLSGVIYLSFQYYFALRGDYDHGHVDSLEAAGLFWHFVDLVWILVFTFIYLL